MVAIRDSVFWCHADSLRRRLRDPRLLRSHSFQGLFSLIDQAIVSGTSFLTSVIVARCGASETLGAFFLGWNVVTIVHAIQGDVISSPYTVFSRHRTERELPAFTGSVLLQQLILALSSAVLVAVAMALLGRSTDHGLNALHGASLAFIAALPFILLRQFIRGLNYAHLRVGAATLVDLCIAVFQLSGLLLLGATGRLSVSTVYTVLGVAAGLPSIAWLWRRNERLRFDLSLVISHWRENWSFGRWALAGQLTGRATSYLVPWSLALIHGEATTGVFAACLTLVNMGGTFITGVGNYLTPAAAAAYASEGIDAMKSLLRKTAWVYLGVIGPFVVLLAMFGGIVARTVYGPDFAGNEVTLRLLALSLLINSMTIVVGNGLWAMRRPHVNFRADCTAMFVGLSVLALTVKTWGPVGAAFSLAASNLAGLAVQWWNFRCAAARESNTRTQP